MFLYSKMKFSVLLIQSKLPGATAAIIGNIRIAAKTFASNAFIYCFSKTAIFNYTYRFTRMILHLFSFAGCLHMTFKRAIHQSFIVFPQNNLIIIYIRIKNVAARLLPSPPVLHVPAIRGIVLFFSPLLS